MSFLNPKTTALLVIHLQHDIVSENTAFGSIFNQQVVENDILAKCNATMQVVRNAGGLVIPARIAFAPDYSNLKPNIPLLQMVQQAGCLKDGEVGADIVTQIHIDPNDVLITHQRPGPFTDTNLHVLLQEHGIENVIVCGVATNASVEGAARQASDLGYSTFVVSNASSAASQAAHEASLESLGLIAQIITVEEASASLVG